MRKYSNIKISMAAPLDGADVRRKSSIPPRELLQKAVDIAVAAQESGLVLRLTGGLGIACALRDDPSILEFLFANRSVSADSVFADIDFVSTSKASKHMNDFFVDRLNFSKDRIINALFGDVRRIYYSQDLDFHIDIFIDKLEFNHTLDVAQRLALSFPHLNVPDLLLSKLQIHFINQKDLVDIVAIFCSGEVLKETSVARIMEVLSGDWGFYHDSMCNLDKAKRLVDEMRVTLSFNLDTAADGIEKLKLHLEKQPKSRAWMKRNRKGVSKQWWQDVEEVAR